MEKIRGMYVFLVVLLLFLLSTVLLHSTSLNRRFENLSRADVHIHGLFVINQNTTDPLTGKRGQYGFDSNVIVESDGTLIVENATMYFLFNHTDNPVLTVNGSLILNNSTLTLNWSDSPRRATKIEINGNLNGSSELHIWDSDLYFAWFNVSNKNSNISIVNTSFHRVGNDHYTGLRFYNSFVNISNCSISDGYYGIYTSFSWGSVRGLRIANTTYGMFLYSDLNITDSSFSNCTYGMYVDSARINVKNSSLERGEYGLYLYYANSTLRNMRIGEYPWGIYIDHSAVDIGNVSIMNGCLFTLDDESLQKMNLSNSRVNGKTIVFMKDRNNASVRNAGEIIIYNSTGIGVSDISVSNSTVFGILKYSRVYIENSTGSNFKRYLWVEKSDLLINDTTIMLSRYGIYGDTVNISLFNSTIMHDYFGVYLKDSTGRIQFNSFSGNNYSLWLSKYRFEVFFNHFENSSGLMLDGCTDSKVRNNTFERSGLYLHGDINDLWNSYTTNVIKNNTVNGKPLLFLINKGNYTVGDAGEIICVNTTDITIRDRNISYGDIGIQILLSRNVRIENITTLHHWWHGIYVCFSSNISIYHSESGYNGWSGFYFYQDDNISLSSSECDHNRRGVESYRLNHSEIYGCKISQNYMGIESDDSHFSYFLNNTFYWNQNYAIKLDGCHHLKIWKNYFLYNHNSEMVFNESDIQAYDNSHNQWNNSQYGNYWLDWAENNDTNDENNDGIVDWAYPLDGGARDYKPIKEMSVPEINWYLLVLLLLPAMKKKFI